MSKKNCSHGGPYDRGKSDNYYRRDFDPHWYPEGTYFGERIEMKDMSVEEILEYNRGFRDNSKWYDERLQK